MKKLLSLIVGLFILNAEAGIFLEPYVGYMKAETKQSSVLLSENTFKNTGMAYGARLGFSLTSFFFLAGDALLAKGDYKDSASDVKGSVEILTYSGVAGIQIFDYRVWYGHSFKTKAEYKNSSAGTFDNYEGDGWKVGIGSLLFKKISLNLEYFNYKYDTLNAEKLPASLIRSAENKGFITSISFPLFY